jgi:6-pyruvoyl-tetrahydropterin synthase
MKVSVTERSIFKSCRRKWAYKFVRRLEPLQEESPALWIGIGVHEALEKFYCGEDALTALREWWVFHIEKAPQQVQMSPEATWDLMAAMVGGYAKFAVTADAGVEVLATEHVLRIPIPRTTDGILSGRMDLLIRRNDKIWVVDHKTAAAFVDEATLEFDDQMTAYIWMVHVSTGENIAGAVYNQLKKKIPEKPMVLQNGTLSKNKQQSTTPDLYREAIEESGLNPADYKEMLEFLEANNTFYRREYILRGPQELEAFTIGLSVEYYEMLLAQQIPSLCYRSLTRDCGWCTYRLLCKAEASDTPQQAKDLQEALFYVKEDTSADSQYDDLLSARAWEDHPTGYGSR